MSLIPCSQIMIFLLCFQMAKNRERKPILLQYYIIMFFHSQGLCQWPHLIIIVFCCLCLISLVKWKFHHIGTWHTHYVYSINQVFMLYTIDWPIDFGLENFINELLQKKKIKPLWYYFWTFFWRGAHLAFSGIIPRSAFRNHY